MPKTYFLSQVWGVPGCRDRAPKLGHDFWDPPKQNPKNSGRGAAGPQIKYIARRVLGRGTPSWPGDIILHYFRPLTTLRVCFYTDFGGFSGRSPFKRPPRTAGSYTSSLLYVCQCPGTCVSAGDDVSTPHRTPGEVYQKHTLSRPVPPQGYLGKAWIWRSLKAPGRPDLLRGGGSQKYCSGLTEKKVGCIIFLKNICRT